MFDYFVKLALKGLRPSTKSTMTVFSSFIHAMKWKVKLEYTITIWDKVFKSGLSKFCGRQPLKNLKRYGLPQILLGPLLNTLSHIWVVPGG